MIGRLVLVGLSGSGKTTAATSVAFHLGWHAVDIDALIEQRMGKTIPELFRDAGELAFRAIERDVLLEALASDHVVVATGGGAVANNEIWNDARLVGQDVLTVWLDGTPDRLVQRLRDQAAICGASAERPLLKGDARGRLERMLEERSPYYARANVVLPVDQRGPDDVTADLVELVRLDHGVPSRIALRGRDSSSGIFVAAGSIQRLPAIIAERFPVAGRIWFGIDSGVEPFVRDQISELFGSDLRTVNSFVVPAGESSKRLGGLGRIYDAVLEGGLERGDVMVAVGGGMTGDLVGFAAATLLRGVGLVQVPTTLLSMVDSSVGGKTAINHDSGKNLIGAFYQPHCVVIDPHMLGTLPDREYRSGWAEIIKHAVIQRSTPGGARDGLLETLERNADALIRRDQPLLDWVIRQNVSLKAAVVEEDEHEAGIRAFLNFGHTIGHGVEAAGYQLLHGEAIAVGMVGALRIARELGRIDQTVESRIVDLIARFGLPVNATVDPAEVLMKMRSDKKKQDGTHSWVLPNGNLEVGIVRDIPLEIVKKAIDQVGTST